MLHVCVCVCVCVCVSTQNGLHAWQSAEVRKKVFKRVSMWIFLLQKHMDLLQEGFIHPPEPCEARFITDMCALQTKTPTYSHPNAW